MSVKPLTVVALALVVFVLGAGRMWLRHRDSVSEEATVKFRSDPRVLLDIARERLQTRFSFIDALDTKVATMFAAGSALLGLLAAVFAVRPDEFDREALIVVCIAGFDYAILTLAAIAALWIREYYTGPQLPAIWEDAQEKEERQLIADLAVDYRVSIDEANKWASIKEWAARVAILAVLFQTMMLGLALAVVTS